MPDEFAEQILEAHNSRRKAHKAPLLKYSEELQILAQAWAERLARQAHISYSELSGIGENITFFPYGVDAETVVEHWYGEHEKYEYETPGWQSGTNYFTQVVWKSTEEIGIGRALVGACSDGDIDGEISAENSIPSDASLAAEGDQVIVAFYRPSGNNNRAGQFAVNVLKPTATIRSPQCSPTSS